MRRKHSHSLASAKHAHHEYWSEEGEKDNTLDTLETAMLRLEANDGFEALSPEGKMKAIRIITNWFQRFPGGKQNYLSRSSAKTDCYSSPPQIYGAPAITRKLEVLDTLELMFDKCHINNKE